MRMRPCRRLIFDSHYDSYKGVVAYVRVMDGAITADRHPAADGDRRQSSSRSRSGIFAPGMRPTPSLIRRRSGLCGHRA